MDMYERNSPETIAANVSSPLLRLERGVPCAWQSCVSMPDTEVTEIKGSDDEGNRTPSAGRRQHDARDGSDRQQPHCDPVEPTQAIMQDIACLYDK